MFIWVFWFVVATAVCLTLSILGWKFGMDGDHEATGPIMFTLGGVASIIFLVCAVCVFVGASGAGPRAALLNRAFGTTYTAEDIFWGDDIVKETIQGARNRIDLSVERK